MQVFRRRSNQQFVNALLRSDDEESDSDTEVLRLTVDDTDIDEDSMPSLVDDESDDEDDDEVTAAVQVVSCLSHKQTEQVSRRDTLKCPPVTGTDTLSTLSAVRDKRLVLSTRQTEAVTTSALDSESDSTTAAEVIFGGSCRYVPGAKMSTLCEDPVVDTFPAR